MKKVVHKQEAHINHIITGILVSVTVLASAFLSATKVSADETKVSKTASVTVPDACTMTGTGMNSHTAEIANGNYVSEIGSTTLKIICNDGGGFSVYAIGFTGDAYEGEDHTKLIGTSTGQKIVTGTATGAGSSDVSNWAMKVGTDSSATYPLTLDNSFDSYHAVSDTYTKVAYRNSGTDIGLSATGSELTTTYAAYVSRTQSADTYDGKVKYTLVHPATGIPPQPVACPSGKICYNPNGGNVIGTMGQQSAGNNASVTLLASNFSRDGYGFAGWSDKFDYSDGANFYGPQETITTPADTSTKGLSLYAVWVKSAGKLQSDATSICATLTQAPTTGRATLASVSALTDARDNQTYAIAKLSDGNCWMIENLRLDSTNLDNSTGALAQGYGTSAIHGNFVGLADSESDHFDDDTTANSIYYSGTQSGTASINIGVNGYPGYRMPRYNNSNTSARASNPTSNNVSMYSYGNYYSWPAAKANTDRLGNEEDSETALTSICPAGGWQLPYGDVWGHGSGDTSGGFPYLDVQLGGNGRTSDSSTNPTGAAMSKKWRSFPNNFLYSGNIFASEISRSAGNYWSGTAYTDGAAFSVNIRTNAVEPGDGGSGLYSNYNGYSVRCVFVSGS